MKLNRSFIFALLASLSAVPFSLQAMPLISESFDYELGVTVVGQGQAMDGWSGAWETSGGTNAELESVITGLTFAGLEVSGGASQRTARFGLQAMSRTISTTAQSALTADNSTIWFRVLMQATAPTDPIASGGFAPNTFGTLIIGSDGLNGADGIAAAPISGSGSGFGVSFAGVAGASDFANIQIQGVSYNGGALTEGAADRLTVGDGTILVVGSITWAADGADDVLNLYVVTDVTAPLPDPFVTMADDFDQSTFDVISIGAPQTSVFDEIQFGLNLSDILGDLGETVSPEITTISYDASSDPGNILVTITFNSELGRSYTAFVTSDLEVPLLERADVDDGILGEDGSTTFVIDFDQSFLDKDVSRFFVVIAENPPSE